MARTKFSIDIFGDRLPWMYKDMSSGDNRRQLEMLKKALSRAMEDELTERQRQMVEEFYFNNKTVSEIALQEGVNKSTVSRHLKRSREKLRQVLKYGFFPVWQSEY